MEYLKKNQINWFDNAYFDYQKRQGGRRTTSEFAKFLGYGQSTVSLWMNGKRRPNLENCICIAKIISDVAIFGACGYDIPEDCIYLLPVGFRDPLEHATREVNQALKERGLYDSPEAEEITIEIFEKWGFKFKAKQKGK